MKLSMFISFVLLASGIFFAFSVMVQDLETNYVESGIVDVAPMNASYLENYNQSSQLEESFSDIKDSFEDLSKPSGWFDRIVDVAAIPLLIITFPLTILEVVSTTILNLDDILLSVGIPKEIIYLIGIGLIVWIIIKLINFLNSKDPI